MNEATLDIQDGKATLTGDLTFATVTGLYQRMRAAGADDMPESIDLSGISKIDSAGLALLLEWQSAFKKLGNSASLMEVHNPPAALIKIARLCDAGEYLADDSNRGHEHA